MNAAKNENTSAAADSGAAQELAAAIREIRERVRSQHPVEAAGSDGAIPLADLLPLLHARDAAEGKVAAIGRVNPRPPGPLNSIIQFFKNLIARGLDWHVRDQIEFNRGVMQCVQATLDALDENNRALSRMAAEAVALRAEAAELRDIRTHWQTWSQAWDEKRNTSEIYMLRSISELQHAFQHRVSLLEQSLRATESAFRDSVQVQHDQYKKSLEEAAQDIQEKLWADLEKIRREYEALIHSELKVLRQRRATESLQAAAAAPALPASAAAAPMEVPEVDWLRFAERFRGSEERIRGMQSRYVERFAGARNVLDIGCGRGEFLEAAREAGIGANGIDLSAESVALCRDKGLQAEVADLWSYLPSLADASLGGVYCSQVIEHIQPERLPAMIRLIGAKLRPGAIAAFETPNPECLATLASHFFIDPTHTRPVPASLLAFYLEEAGFGRIETEQFAPAVESWPELSELPERVRVRFFGGLDYRLFAVKL